MPDAMERACFTFRTMTEPVLLYRESSNQYTGRIEVEDDVIGQTKTADPDPQSKFAKCRQVVFLKTCMHSSAEFVDLELVIIKKHTRKT